MLIDGSGNRIARPIITNTPPVKGGDSPGNIKGKQSLPAGRTNEANGFDSILKKKLCENGELRFSKHAEQRLQSRDISLTQVQKDKVRGAVDKAQSKGVRDSLILMDDLAFVVNIKNRTVITAANSSELKDSVFTNIDGAVII